MKICLSCGEEKPSTEFGACSLNEDGMRSDCHACSQNYPVKKGPKKKADKLAKAKDIEDESL